MQTLKRKVILDAGVYVAFIVTLVVALAPLIWIAVTSIKNTADIFLYPPVLVPRKIALDNYLRVFDSTEIGRNLFNSVAVAVMTTLAVVVLSTLAAYGFSRSRSRSKSVLMLLLLGGQMIPAVTNIIPLYVTMLRLGLLDTLTALFLVYTAVNVPFSVWIVKAYIDTIPDSIDEAALIDGAGRFRIIFGLIVPVSLPGIAAASLFTFIACWNEFYVALVLTSTVKSKTLPLGLFNFQASYDIQWNLLSAAAVVALVPIIVMFLLLEDKFVSGLTRGAYKG